MSNTIPSWKLSQNVKYLQLILRMIGIGGLLAIPAIIIPIEWMQLVHRQFLPGDLPATTSVNYLARSLAMFYALSGLLTLFISFDIQRYLPLVKLWGVCAIAKGVIIAFVDLYVGYPLWWMTIEGLFSILIGVWICQLCRQLDIQAVA